MNREFKVPEGSSTWVKEVYEVGASIKFKEMVDIVTKPWAGIKPAPSHQAGLAGGGDLPAPGFFLFEANPGVGTISALVAAEGPILGPKSYAQALMGLAGPG
ncbi:hypothetical protein DSO57_1008125 [Entomophthora muscae]|uniref:Uncharacterized protein n=1 Tax=Entomophthora muscae TaxID=34485 RepID=A0ACC2TVB0_9FUNG|nr:hypothetical protein DSO57_1008125 [Entomophthora muscae]